MYATQLVIGVVDTVWFGVSGDRSTYGNRGGERGGGWGGWGSSDVYRSQSDGGKRERETKTHRLLSRVPNGDRRGPQSRETPVQYNVPEQRTGSELFMLLYWNVAHKALKP